MKIKRFVNGVEMEFELTQEEVAEAYLEHEHYYDVESVRGDLNSGCYEEFEGLSDEEWENAVHEIAYEARHQMEKYGLDEWDAKEAARKKYIEDHNLEGRQGDGGDTVMDFILSEDTDFGVDLMAFISDWQEDLGFSVEDIAKIRENVCFGVIALDVEGYLMLNDCSLEDIDISRYAADERAMDLVHVVSKAYQDYLKGNYTESTVRGFVDDFRANRGKVVDCVLADAERCSVTPEGGTRNSEKGIRDGMDK